MVNKFNFNACCGCADENGVWFIQYKLTILLYFDFSQKKITVAKKIPNIKLNSDAAFFSIFSVDNEVILIPNSAARIYIYNKINEVFLEKDISSSCIGISRNAILYNKKIYCIPNIYDYIICYDITRGNIKYITDIDKMKKDYVCDTAIDNDKIYYIFAGDNKVRLFDAKYEKNYVYIEFKNAHLKNIAIVGNKIVLYDELTRQLYRFDKLTKKMDKEFYIGIEKLKLNALFGKYLCLERIDKPYFAFYDEDFNKISEDYKKVDNLALFSGYYHSVWINNYNNKVIEITANNYIKMYDISLKVNSYEITMDDITYKYLLDELIEYLKNNISDIYIENNIIDLKKFLLNM